MPKHKETDPLRKWMKENTVWQLDLCKMLERKGVETLSDLKSLNKDTVLDIIDKCEETGFIHSSRLKKLHGGFKISLELKIFHILSYWLRSEIITTKNEKHNYCFIFSKPHVNIISKYAFGDPQYYQFIENFFKLSEISEPIKGVEYQYSWWLKDSDGWDHIKWILHLRLKDKTCYYAYIKGNFKQCLNGYGKWNMKNENTLLINIQLSSQSDREFKKNGSMYEKSFKAKELIRPDWSIDHWPHRERKIKFKYIYQQMIR